MTEAEWSVCRDPTPMLAFLDRGILALVDDLPTEAGRQAVRAFLQ